jgi:intein/homing endonuclease
MIQGNYGYRASAPFGFGRENSPFSILGSYGILDRMARYCLSGDMRIAINNKEGSINLQELVEHYEKFPEQKYHTFSYNKEKNEMVLAEIKHAFFTKIDEIVEVHLEDGSIFKCTKEHPLMLRDGSYCEAKDLKEDMALMPFYRKNLKKYKTNNNIYRVVYSPSEGWRGEHKIVAEYMIGNKNLAQENKHVHHKDYNGLNNIISNLEVLDKDVHMLMHAKEGKRSSQRIAEKHHLRALENISAIKSVKHNTGRSLYKNSKKEEKKSRFKNGNADTLFTIETIKENWEPNITAHQLAKKCQVHYGKFNTRLKWSGYDSYVDFVQNNFDSKYNLKYKKPRHLLELPNIQDVYNNYQKSITSTKLSKKLGVTSEALLVILRRNGYISWHDFTETYKNHKVKKIVFTGRQEKVYDITVEPYHNFAVYDPTGKSSIISHNSEFSEMDYQPEIASALDIHADETVGGDDRGKCFHIYSDKAEIKAALDDLFYDVLNVEFNLRSWIRNLVKYGDFFLFNEVHPDLGIINVIPIPVNEIEREEGFDEEDPYAVRFKCNSFKNSWK